MRLDALVIASVVVLTASCGSADTMRVESENSEGTSQSDQQEPVDDVIADGAPLGSEVTGTGQYVVADGEPLLCYGGLGESNSPSCTQFVRLSDPIELPPEISLTEYKTSASTVLVGSSPVSISGTVERTESRAGVSVDFVLTPVSASVGSDVSPLTVAERAPQPPQPDIGAYGDPDSETYSALTTSLAEAGSPPLSVSVEAEQLVVTVIWADQRAVESVLSSVAPDIAVRVDSWLQ